MANRKGMFIVLDIDPPKSTGQSGKRLGVMGGHATMFKTKEAYAVENLFRAILYQKKPPEKFSGNVAIKLTYLFPYLKTKPSKTIQKKGYVIPKTTKPDYDNIPKQIMDVMTKLGYWTDDSIIYRATIQKYFAPKGQIIIEIHELPDDACLTTTNEFMEKLTNEFSQTETQIHKENNE